MIFTRRVLTRGALIGVAAIGTTYYWPQVKFGGKATVRVTRSFLTVACIGVDYKFSLSHFWRKQANGKLSIDDAAAYEAKKHAVHLRAAKWLLWLFQLNGGIYIKLGQHLATLDFILPTEYTQTLSVLFNKAPQSTADEIEKVIVEELGGHSLKDHFDEFDYPPIGAASLAQVHKARLRGSGDVVAVKVQHERLKGFADVDIVTAAVLVKAVKAVFPQFEFTWLAEELRENLPRELNFLIEGHNAERTGRNFSNSGLFRVPKIYWAQTGKRVLTMEYCTGDRVNDVDNLAAKGISLRQVSDRLTKAYSEMIFVHGFVHCDPHPGNILVDKHGELVLLDHGLYKELSHDFRLSYARLWKALVDGDERAIELESKALGGGSAHRLFSSILTHRSWDKVKGRSLNQPRTLAEIEAIRGKFPEYFEKIALILASVPRPLLLLLKTNDLLRCIDRTLLGDNTSGTRSFLIMARYCSWAIFEDDLLRRTIFGSLISTFRYVYSIAKYRLAELFILYL